MAGRAKELIWIGSSLEDLKSFPEAARKATGFALRAAQERFKAVSAKPLRGFGGASVLEIVENRDGDTYRAVYTVNFEEAVYVLHCFKKKSKSGIATPKQDLDLVKQRFRAAQQEHKKWQEEQKSKK